MDCSGLVRAAFKDCGITTMNGLSSTGMAQRCNELGILFTDPSQLQAGDLIFFTRKDAKRGAGYCTDTRRCGTGKCKRWLRIHHVAIYINEEFLIDSTGGKNSVQIRKHWGKSGSEWSWMGFGRLGIGHL
jgi:cell wall-associated NlpC family hydrolase